MKNAPPSSPKIPPKWPWQIWVQINRGHQLNQYYLSLKFEACRYSHTQVIVQKWPLPPPPKWPWPWWTGPQINRDHHLIKDHLSMKFEACSILKLLNGNKEKSKQKSTKYDLDRYWTGPEINKGLHLNQYLLSITFEGCRSNHTQSIERK